jgi:signal recognition particle subunit SRP54
VVLMVGVNGTGKTTTAAKPARRLRAKAAAPLAAADTYRAGAVAQRQVCRPSGLPGGGRPGRSRPVAFNAIDAAQSAGSYDHRDTAGRLHTRGRVHGRAAEGGA